MVEVVTEADVPEPSSIDPPANPRSAAVRLARFGAGLLVGAVLFAGLLFGGGMMWNELHAADVALQTSGADISGHGGVRLAIRRRTGVVVQSCNGGCDDLSIVNRTRSNGLRDIRVLNSQGGCVACVAPPGVALGQRRDDWTIAGPSRLAIARTADASAGHD